MPGVQSGIPPYAMNQPVAPGQYGQQPQPPGYQQPVANSQMQSPFPTPPAGANQAVDMIRNILTQPRPMGAVGTPNQPQVPGQGQAPGGAGINGMPAVPFALGQQGNMGGPGANPGGNTIGGGIGGVASTLEAEGIKLYKERSKYNEWEFVYDPKEDKSRGGGPQGRLPNQNPGPLTGPTGPPTGPTGPPTSPLNGR
jgi:hypothetical protein